MSRTNLKIGGACLLMACLIFTSCRSLTSPTNPDDNANNAHHQADGFVNRYADRSDKPGLWRWQFERLRDGLPKPPEVPVLGVAPNLELIKSNNPEPRLTWVGHATLLVQVNGINLLTRFALGKPRFTI